MGNHTEKDKVPFRAPQWLLEAAKNAPPPPSKALLGRLRVARDPPDQLVRKLRDDTSQSRRDSDAFPKVMAQVKRDMQAGKLAQDVHPAGIKTNRSHTNLPIPATIVAPASPEPRCSSAEMLEGAATQTTARPALPSAPGQRRVGVKGQITKPAHPQRRDGRNKVPRKTPNSGATSSASGTVSPMVVDSPQTPAKPLAMETVRETLNATSRMLENQSLASTLSTTQSYPFPVRFAMPAWYDSISQQKKSQLEKKRPQEIAAIDALKDCIRRCEKGLPSRLSQEYNALRDHVHKAEIKLDMDRSKVKRTGIITRQNGLPRIFAQNAEHTKFPWDLKADAWHLYEKWMNEDFDNDILRGIVTVKGKDRSGDRLDPAYREKHPKDPKVFGDNGAILGQWWPSQLCAVRDGVHGAAQGGIYGDKGGGTYSIVLSSGGYHDHDDGDVIEYSGTEGSDGVIKAATQSMITSSKLGNHIRVLRSSQLPKSNKYRPSCGLRYDGLYQIRSYTEIDKEKQTYRFHLERIPGQEPIRSQGVTKRPTVFEEEAYQKCKGRI